MNLIKLFKEAESIIGRIPRMSLSDEGNVWLDVEDNNHSAIVPNAQDIESLICAALRKWLHKHENVHFFSCCWDEISTTGKEWNALAQLKNSSNQDDDCGELGATELEALIKCAKEVKARSA